MERGSRRQGVDDSSVGHAAQGSGGSRRALVMKETRSKILFRAVEEFERLRGSNLAWFGLDELTYAQEEAWLRLEGRLRDPKASRLCGFAVWTPKGYDWVYERFVAAHIQGYEVVAAQAFENRHLLERVPDYYERLKSSYDARFYQQEVLGQYLQFGEVQWWYFPNDGLGHPFSGMPFYDAWTAGQFLTLYGRAMTVFTDNTADPASYPDEAAFLPAVIGDFTDAIMTFVRATYADARFEVLYPLDVNQTSFNRAVNYPSSQWTATTLDCLKTEAFGFTLQRNLEKSEQSMLLSGFPAFPAAQRSQLVGVGDATTAWAQEAQFAEGRGFESVVLFALDQMCLVGYALPLAKPFRRSIMMGS